MTRDVPQDDAGDARLDADSGPGTSKVRRVSAASMSPTPHDARTWRIPADSVASLAGGGTVVVPSGRAALLQQAEALGEGVDWRFTMKRGEGDIGGHREVLSADSIYLAAMIGSGMSEAINGCSDVPEWASRRAMLALLELVYLGHAGRRCEEADGCEVWRLACHFEVSGRIFGLLHRSLGKDRESLLAAMDTAATAGKESSTDAENIAQLVRECVLRVPEALSRTRNGASGRQAVLEVPCKEMSDLGAVTKAFAQDMELFCRTRSEALSGVVLTMRGRDAGILTLSGSEKSGSDPGAEAASGLADGFTEVSAQEVTLDFLVERLAPLLQQLAVGNVRLRCTAVSLEEKRSVWSSDQLEALCVSIIKLGDIEALALRWVQCPDTHLGAACGQTVSVCACACLDDW